MITRRYWVLKMGMWFSLADGWLPRVPMPTSLAADKVIVEENPGAVLVDGGA